MCFFVVHYFCVNFRGIFRTIARVSTMEEINVNKNNSILGKNVLLRRCLTIRKYVPELGLFLFIESQLIIYLSIYFQYLAWTHHCKKNTQFFQTTFPNIFFFIIIHLFYKSIETEGSFWMFLVFFSLILKMFLGEREGSPPLAGRNGSYPQTPLTLHSRHTESMMHSNETRTTRENFMLSQV